MAQRNQPLYHTDRGAVSSFKGGARPAARAQQGAPCARPATVAAPPKASTTGSIMDDIFGSSPSAPSAPSRAPARPSTVLTKQRQPGGASKARALLSSAFVPDQAVRTSPPHPPPRHIGKMLPVFLPAWPPAGRQLPPRATGQLRPPCHEEERDQKPARAQAGLRQAGAQPAAESLRPAVGAERRGRVHHG
jgi:hypothetical protein